jgi:hypothetical protein
MKKILLFVLLSLSFMSTAQYEDEIKMLNHACSTPFYNLDKLFTNLEGQVNQGVYLYADDFNDHFYIIEYENGRAIASYVEAYNRDSLKAMKMAIKKASNEYYYVVSSFKKDNTILITSTKK